MPPRCRACRLRGFSAEKLWLRNVGIATPKLLRPRAAQSLIRLLEDDSHGVGYWRNHDLGLDAPDDLKLIAIMYRELVFFAGTTKVAVLECVELGGRSLEEVPTSAKDDVTCHEGCVNCVHLSCLRFFCSLVLQSRAERLCLSLIFSGEADRQGHSDHSASFAGAVHCKCISSRVPASEEKRTTCTSRALAASSWPAQT